MKQHWASVLLRMLCVLLLPMCAFAAKYTVEPDFDRPGDAYESFVQTGGYQDHTLCRDACESQPRCRSYTYVKPGVAGEQAVCKLRDTVPPPVESFCCISAVKGGKAAQPAIAAMSLEWLSQDSDKVSRDGRGVADGASDHHWRLQLRSEAPQQIVTIELREDSSLKPLRWSSLADDNLHLAVELDGRRLNANANAQIGTVPGNAVLDLYAHDIGQWEVGRPVIAEVVFADGRRVTHTFSVTAPPDRLLGLWQMLCGPSSPDAFEPMTLSGRVMLIVAPDGSVSGQFGSAPATGKLDASGHLAGSAENSDELVEWNGQLDGYRPGKPIRGSGSYRFVRTKQACTGEGMWSSH